MFLASKPSSPFLSLITVDEEHAGVTTTVLKQLPPLDEVIISLAAGDGYVWAVTWDDKLKVLRGPGYDSWEEVRCYLFGIYGIH